MASGGWRGEAFLADKAYAEALTELTCAAAQALEIGRVRLRLDLELALARLFSSRDQQHEAVLHGRNAIEIREMIDKSLVSSGLRARWLSTDPGGRTS